MRDRYIEVKPFTFDGKVPHIVRHESTGLYLVRAVVLGELGLHARPAMEFAKRATEYVKKNGTGIRVARLDGSGKVYRGAHVMDEDGHVDGTSIRV